MKLLKTLLSTVLLVLLVVQITDAQEKPSFILNKISDQSLEKSLETDSQADFFELNGSIFSDPDFRPGAQMDVEISAGEIEKLVLKKRVEYTPGTVSIHAYAEDNPSKILVATYSKGTFNGIFYNGLEDPAFFRHDIEKTKNYVSTKKVEKESLLACGINDFDKIASIPKFSNPGMTQKSKAAPLFTAVDDSITIDLMIVYTNAAENWANNESGLSDINGVIAQSINLSQLALDNSNTGINLRLVHTHKLTYNEETDGVSSGQRLSRLIQNPANPTQGSEHDGFMEEIHALRTQFGADVVSMYARIDDTGGIAPLLNSPSGTESQAFNLNRVQQVTNTYTVIHEIGHNMGSNHSKTQDSQAANDGGGLFQYSVGYQDANDDFVTVMGYVEKIDQFEIPYFSSPSLTYEGNPTGSTSQDNARSIREIKRTFANYRTTIVDAPEASLLANVISIEMNREDDLAIPFQIFNDGDSPLVWDIDFEFSNQGSLGKAAILSENRIEKIAYPEGIARPFNYSRVEGVYEKSVLTEETIYSTSFENGEGFSTGSFTGTNEWKSFTDEEFAISSSNPNTGSQHYRIESNSSEEPQFLSAPFLGYQSFGSYEISFHLSISGASVENEVLYIDFYDGKNGEQSAGFVINQNILFIADLNEQGEVTYSGSSGSISSAAYEEVRIFFNTVSEKVEYFYKGVLIAQRDYLNGFSPGEMVLTNLNSIAGATFDIDDLEIRQINSPAPWLNVTTESGVTLESSSSSSNLNFNTVGISAGTYNLTMNVSTNDPQNEEIQVPITLMVANVVSNEETEGPERISLEQNYPNPFNPATNITYTLETAESISLEVYNIQGQKVATLFEGMQTSGEHTALFDASNLSSGIYLYRLQTGSQVFTRQMVLIK